VLRTRCGCDDEGLPYSVRRITSVGVAIAFGQSADALLADDVCVYLARANGRQSALYRYKR
jgi:hypothetical protein